MVNWYIQESRDSSNLSLLQSIIYMIQESGMKVYSEKYVPFGGMDYSFLPLDEPVIALTGISAVQDHQERKLSHKPFAWFDQKKLCCAHYYAYYGEHLLQKHYGFYPLAEIVRQENWLYQTFANEKKSGVY